MATPKADAVVDDGSAGVQSVWTGAGISKPRAAIANSAPSLATVTAFWRAAPSFNPT